MGKLWQNKCKRKKNVLKSVIIRTEKRLKVYFPLFRLCKQRSNEFITQEKWIKGEFNSDVKNFVYHEWIITASMIFVYKLIMSS